MAASDRFAYTGGNDFAATDKDPIHTLYVLAESIRTHRIGATIARCSIDPGPGDRKSFHRTVRDVSAGVRNPMGGSILLDGK